MASYVEKVLRQAVEHQRAGRMAEAETSFRKAAAMEPNNVEALGLLGRFLTLTGRGAEAVDVLTRAAGRQPADPWLMIDLSEACRAAARIDDAVEWLCRTARAHPGFVEAHNNLGGLYVMLGRDAEAEAALSAALRLRPGHPEALLNFGNLRAKRGRHEEAIGWYRQLLEANPGHAGGWANLAAVYQETGLAAEAIDAFERAIALAGDHPVLWDNYLLAMNRLPGRAPADVLAAHRQYGRRFVDVHASLRRPHRNDRTPDRRLKVGYVSFDFRRHSVAYFVEPILANHDRSDFHVTCYSSVVAPDEVTARLRSLADAWHDVAALNEVALADLVRADGIDILVDLSGHTEGNRLQAFGLAPAPVQVTYLGYPNTTGVAPIQYRLTDALADPPGMTEQWHTEELLRLPRTAWCYLPPADAPEVTPRPDRPITFGSFNTFSKVTDDTIALWASVLQTVPESRLLVKARALADQQTQRLAAERFARHGVAADRLELIAWDPSVTSHLATYARLDIALDTFPYNGTTTTCEALWMGVPAVTLAGQTHVSRVGASLLTNAGLPDLVASTPEGFTETAAPLAGDLSRLASLRSTLRDQLQRSGLCDAATFTRELEACYHTIWRKWCSSPTSSG